VFSMSKGETRSCGGRARERALFVFMGSTSAFLYRKLLPELASRGLEGSLLICRDWVLPIGRPISITAGAGWPRGISKPSTRQGIRNFHLVVHDIGGAYRV